MNRVEDQGHSGFAGVLLSAKQKKGRSQCALFRIRFVDLYKVTKQRLFACVFHLTADVSFTRKDG